ncbi:hypothetical protein Hanom_Chr17g01547841 [Helianthus anomalus]
MLFTSSLILSKLGEHLSKTRRKVNPKAYPSRLTIPICSKQKYLRWISEVESSWGTESTINDFNHRPKKQLKIKLDLFSFTLYIRIMWINITGVI